MINILQAAKNTETHRNHQEFVDQLGRMIKNTAAEMNSKRKQQDNMNNSKVKSPNSNDVSGILVLFGKNLVDINLFSQFFRVLLFCSFD